MDHESPDDIAALCSYAQFDPAQYKRFRSNVRSKQSPPCEKKVTESEETGVPAPQPKPSRFQAGIAHATTDGDGPENGNAPGTNGNGRLPGYSNGNGRVVDGGNGPASLVRSSAPDSRWLALQALSEAVAPAGTRQQSAAAPQPKPPSLSLFSAKGGVGASTILATLGRLLSSMRERVVLVDGLPQSMVRHHFSARSVRKGPTSYVAMNAGEPPVHIISDEGGDPDESWLWRGLADVRNNADRLLVNTWLGMSPATQCLLCSGGVCVMVLTPDLHSVLAARHAAESWQKGQFQSPAELYFLLNKYDESVALHVDIRRALADQYADRFLPFALRRTDEVAEALAEGMTVVDYAPNSGIVEDFFQLAEWLRAIPDAARAQLWTDPAQESKTVLLFP